METMKGIGRHLLGGCVFIGLTAIALSLWGVQTVDVPFLQSLAGWACLYIGAFCQGRLASPAADGRRRSDEPTEGPVT